MVEGEESTIISTTHIFFPLSLMGEAVLGAAQVEGRTQKTGVSTLSSHSHHGILGKGFTIQIGLWGCFC